MAEKKQLLDSSKLSAKSSLVLEKRCLEKDFFYLKRKLNQLSVYFYDWNKAKYIIFIIKTLFLVSKKLKKIANLYLSRAHKFDTTSENFAQQSTCIESYSRSYFFI